LVRHTVEGVIRQTIDSWELILVDQSHTDDITKYLAALAEPRIRHIRDEGIGKSRALNLGLAQSRRTIVACTDDDCVPQPDWAAQLLAAYAKDPALCMVGGPVLPPANQPENNRLVHCPQYRGGDFSWKGGDGCSDYILNKTVHGMMGANISYKRDALLSKVGLFDVNLGPNTRYPSGEDRDISIRIWRAGLAFASISSAIVDHRYGTREGDDILQYLKIMHRSKGALAMKHLRLGDLITYRHFLRQEGLFGGVTVLQTALERDAKLGSVGKLWPFVRMSAFFSGMLDCMIAYGVDKDRKLLVKRGE
jgi:GT2 family glycosyltransferase